MKSKVRLSLYSFAITLVITVVLIGCCVATFHERPGFFIVLGILLLILIPSLLCAPVSITADKDYVTVNTRLRRQPIPVRRIESVELFQPTMAAYRLFASGGYFGYWGLFREGDIGRYMAFYGKASDCFLIKLKNGDKFVLGCENPGEMVNYIKKIIS